MPPRVLRLRLTNFKGFSSYSVHLKKVNVFVGANNAGKSTVLDAFRALSGAMRFARTRLPSRVRGHDGRLVYGYQVPESSIPINLQNLQTDYSDDPSQLDFHLEGGEIIRLSLSRSKGPILALDSEVRVGSLAQFRERYPTHVAVVPTLGPLEEEEELLTKEYVDRWSGTRRTHRLFRNYWLNQSYASFEDFKERLENSWPGMTVMRPERDWSARTVHMFAKEGRIDREVGWAGFGFQVWMQAVTHLQSARDASLVVIDEPEVYLHPDLQHKLFAMLCELPGQVLLATHSVEVINDAEADELVLVNKVNRHAKRLTDADSVQGVVQALGSTQNIVLSRLSSSKKLLFFEGQDFRIVRKLAGRLGLTSLQSAAGVQTVPVGGFTQAHRVESVAWTFKQILQTDVQVAALFDKDYRCEEENGEFLERMREHVPLVFILGRKEIENYLLDLDAIEAAINERLRDAGKPLVSTSFVAKLFDKVADSLKPDVAGQIAAHRSRYFQNRGTKKDVATLITASLLEFESDWTEPEKRVRMLPGKSMLAALNLALQRERQVSISESGIIRHLSASSVDADFRKILDELNAFAE